MPKKYPNDTPTTRDIYNAWLIFSGDRRGVYEPQVDREFYNWLNKTLRENAVSINTPKPGVDHDGPLEASNTIPAGSTYTAYFDISPEMWAKLTKNVGYDPDNKWELEEADIETFDCTMVKLTENNPYDQKWVPSGTVADLYTTEYILWSIDQALNNARKPWLHAQPGETWLIHAYNDYRDCDMWMIAETENNMFVVEPAIPNDSFNMYYQLDSPSIHTAQKLGD